MTTQQSSRVTVTTFLILAAGSLILFYAIGTRQGFGLFLKPMSKELEWGREVFSIAIGLQNLLWGASQPFIGAIADRYGPGRVVAVGAAFYALGLYLMGTTTSQFGLYVGAGFVVGISLSAVSFAVVFGAVARAVPPERQGMALGHRGRGRLGRAVRHGDRPRQDDRKGRPMAGGARPRLGGGPVELAPDADHLRRWRGDDPDPRWPIRCDAGRARPPPGRRSRGQTA